MLLSATVVACDSGSTLPVATGSFPLVPALWYMRSANDSALPATIATRAVGIAQEQTIVDSAQLTVYSNGDYRQRYWLRILINGALDRTEVVLDEGVLTKLQPVYEFSSTVRARVFTVTVPQSGTVITSEPMVFFSSAPTTTGRYQLTPP